MYKRSHSHTRAHTQPRPVPDILSVFHAAGLLRKGARPEPLETGTVRYLQLKEVREGAGEGGKAREREREDAFSSRRCGTERGRERAREQG